MAVRAFKRARRYQEVSVMRCAVLAVLFTFSLSLHTLPAFAVEPLPAVSFRLSCFNDDRTDTEGETDAILALLAFAAAHNGEPVYLDASIEADAGSGFCSRDLAIRNPHGGREDSKPNRISFNGCMAGEETPCIETDMVQINADGPPLAYRHSVVLPPEALLPKNLPYRMGNYGDWLNYRGPFIAHHYEGTGYAYATFHVPDAALAYVWERAAEMSKRTSTDE